ncbi:hypothetical protein N7489_010474 [Penicillium chrysogenum]|uniref:Uncharacterized protein n=1 Tax=Penicillium chrysogenum TaxID=5076 RepID=A0ABQ8WTQ7_PENCH|nr:uncharacterized protein N7489_010474 [Penicillium chrysogenum]KAJ5229766.1 hypothetical protein N7489_010474 [Penicillium chrysogenum]KAJ5259170.1 hypothetical protein N7524_010726 [Penicillium chrysogenum]KAJ5282348.1 hypothetical protein N7505_000328 [Penicillium chrysogenum]KAJ6169646.1 hypothetical protein N7497_002489 [Penicillium chrysogenum]
MATGLDRDMDLMSESNTFLSSKSGRIKATSLVRFIIVVSSRLAPPPIANTSEAELTFLQLFAPRFFLSNPRFFQTSNLNVLYHLKRGIHLCCRLVAR